MTHNAHGVVGDVGDGVEVVGDRVGAADARCHTDAALEGGELVEVDGERVDAAGTVATAAVPVRLGDVVDRDRISAADALRVEEAPGGRGAGELEAGGGEWQGEGKGRGG